MKILEASISVVLVIGIAVFVFIQNTPQQKSIIPDLLPQILTEIAENNEIRNKIISVNILPNIDLEINNTILKSLKNPSLTFKYKICPLSDQSLCNPTEAEVPSSKSVYTSARIISASYTSIDSKIIKIFVWRQ